MRVILDNKLSTCTFGTVDFQGYKVLSVPGDWYVAYDRKLRNWMTFQNGAKVSHLSKKMGEAIQKAGTEV